MNLLAARTKKFFPSNLYYYGLINNSSVDANKIYPLFETSLINGLCGKIYKASTIKEHQLRMPEEIRYAADLIFNIDYLQYCKNIYLTDKAFYQKKIRFFNY